MLGKITEKAIELCLEEKCPQNIDHKENIQSCSLSPKKTISLIKGCLLQTCAHDDADKELTTAWVVSTPRKKSPTGVLGAKLLFFSICIVLFYFHLVW